MQKQRKAPKLGSLWWTEQQEAQWEGFWARIDAISALLDEDGLNLADWVRAPRVMYRLWRMKVHIRQLNRAFGRD